MSGEIDVYQPCLCGSGKKLKFCCQAIVGDMLKVAELQETHQFQAALTLLDATEKKTPTKDVWSRAWIKTTRAFLLFSLGQVDEPRRLTAEVLEELPEHPLAVGINAVLALAVDGYPASMRAIYRAFQISADAQPHVAAFLALSLARALLMKGHPLGGMQNLLIAVAFDPEFEEAAQTFASLLGDQQISYPLRDSYGLMPLVGNETLKEPFERALTLAGRACYSDAAKAFGTVARQDPKQPGLWWNIAICHAFAGEDPLAVEAFKAAAANESDFESAADCLLLSRLLRPTPAEDRAPRFAALYKVESVSKLLTALDHQPEYVRFDLEGHPEETKPAAGYHILDRDPKLVSDEDLAPATVAHIVADLLVFDRRGDDQPPKAFLTTYGRDRLAQVTASFTSLAGPLAAADGEPREQGYLAKERLPLLANWYLPPALSPVRRVELTRECSRHLVDELWPTIAQEALAGKTPLEASRIPELKTALAAAVLDFEALCQSKEVVFDQASVRQNLGLPAVEKQLAEGASPSLCALRLRHTPPEKLSNEHLVAAANHVLRMGLGELAQTLIAEALGRPSLQDKLNVPNLCMALSRICERRFDFEGALNWVVRGKEEARTRKLPLDELAMWELQELMHRSWNREDPQLAAVANHLWNYYVPKLPELRKPLVAVLNDIGLTGPWNAPEVVAAGAPLAAAASGSGLWTPGTEQAGQPSKLWLPGQD